MFIRALRYLTFIGFRRGMAGNRAWMITAIVAVGLRTIRRMTRDEPEVLYRTRLRAGERILVTTRPPD